MSLSRFPGEDPRSGHACPCTLPGGGRWKEARNERDGLNEKMTTSHPGANDCTNEQQSSQTKTEIRKAKLYVRQLCFLPGNGPKRTSGMGEVESHRLPLRRTFVRNPTHRPRAAAHSPSERRTAARTLSLTSAGMTQYDTTQHGVILHRTYDM